MILIDDSMISVAEIGGLDDRFTPYFNVAKAGMLVSERPDVPPAYEKMWFPSTLSFEAHRRFADTGETTRFPTIGGAFVEFVESNLRLVTGSGMSGKPFLFYDMQRRLADEMFRLRWDETSNAWVFQYDVLFIEMAKKQGKSELLAAVCIFLAFLRDGARVIVSSNADHQAKAIVESSKKMVWDHDGLPKAAISGHVLKVIGREIHIKPTESRLVSTIERLARGGGTNDGLNGVSDFVFDELHEAITEQQVGNFKRLRGATASVASPMNLIITTPGFDRNSICYEYHMEHELQTRGLLEAPARYSLAFCMPTHEDLDKKIEVDYMDRANWWLVNPGIGITVQMSYLEKRLREESINDFRRYHLGQWPESSSMWEGVEHWEATAVDEDDERLLFDESQPLFIGVDASYRRDATVVTWCQFTDSSMTDLRIDSRIWENPFEVTSEEYSSWTVPMSEVEDFVADLARQFPEAALYDRKGYAQFGPMVHYDKHFFERSVQIINQGFEDSDQPFFINMVEFGQSPAYMGPASQTLFRYLKSKEIVHKGDKTIRQHFLNTTVKDTATNGWKVSRKDNGPRNPNDAVVSWAMCVYGADLFRSDHLRYWGTPDA